MHMNRAVKIALLVLLAAIPIALVSVHGNEEMEVWPESQLTHHEEQAARTLAERELADPRHGIDPGERIYCTRLQLLPGSEAATTARDVVVTHYRYQGNQAILTFVDLNAEAVSKVEKVVNMPTPLAKEELDLAVELARADLRLAWLFDAYGKDLNIEAKLSWPEEIADPTQPHRSVHLLFRVGREYLSDPRVVVNLVNETVHVQRFNDNS